MSVALTWNMTVPRLVFSFTEMLFLYFKGKKGTENNAKNIFLYAVAKIANLAKNRQTDGKNLNEVTKGVPYKVEKLTKTVNLAKFVLGSENISIT